MHDPVLEELSAHWREAVAYAAGQVDRTHQLAVEVYQATAAVAAASEEAGDQARKGQELAMIRWQRQQFGANAAVVMLRIMRPDNQAVKDLWRRLNTCLAVAVMGPELDQHHQQAQ